MTEWLLFVLFFFFISYEIHIWFPQLSFTTPSVITLFGRGGRRGGEGGGEINEMDILRGGKVFHITESETIIKSRRITRFYLNSPLSLFLCC